MEILGLFINLIALFWLFLYTSLTYKELPKRIPIHFGLSGKPDGYGKKLFYWLIPMLGLLIVIIMFYNDDRLKNMTFRQLSLSVNWKNELSQQIPFFINILVLLCLTEVQNSIYNVSMKKTEKMNKSIWVWIILIVLSSILLPLFLKK